MSNTLVVNFLAGPGAGKSTLAAATFAKLKWEGINCEIVTEYAKDIVWGECYKVLDDQIYVFGKQLHRINRLLGKVDVIVTDAALINSILYYQGTHANTFIPLVLDVVNSMRNMNYLVTRIKKYNPSGRVQTEEESRQLDSVVEMLLKKYDMKYRNAIGEAGEENKICSEIISKLKKN